MSHSTEKPSATRTQLRNRKRSTFILAAFRRHAATSFAPQVNLSYQLHMSFSTPQEEFWAGEFGDQYVDRSEGAKILSSKLAMFARILSKVDGITSVLEFGANIGLNMRAIDALVPGIDLKAVEINERAFEKLKRVEGVAATLGSLLDFEGESVADLTFTAGVLIHINPDAVKVAYEKLYRAARRYILVAEYYSPAPVELSYRGHAGRLFKRDWASEMMNTYCDLKLVEYGFVYHQDPLSAGEDLNWFLMEKRSS